MYQMSLLSYRDAPIDLWTMTPSAGVADQMQSLWEYESLIINGLV